MAARTKECFKCMGAQVSSAPPHSQAKIYDVFLGHAWGQDELGRDTHKRVKKLSKHLRKRGLRTWFDEDDMQERSVL